MDFKDEQHLRVVNRRVLQATRWLLLLVCWCVGAYLLIGGKSTGFGILLLLIGLWLILDNPLEYLEVFEGPCPYCNRQVSIRRGIRAYCPECQSAIVMGSDSVLDEDHEVVSLSELNSLKEAAEEQPQTEPVEISPGDTLDLHTFSPDEVPSLLDEFIALSIKTDIKLVKIIHGKGTGALRRRVQGLLARDPRVATFYDAPSKSGGWGATIVELRPGMDKSNQSSSG